MYSIVLYCIAIVIFYITYIQNQLKYSHCNVSKESLSYLIFGAFLYYSTNIYVIYEIYKGINTKISYTNYHNDTLNLV